MSHRNNGTFFLILVCSYKRKQLFVMLDLTYFFVVYSQIYHAMTCSSWAGMEKYYKYDYVSL